MSFKYNNEGYYDPTAYDALRKVAKAERKKRIIKRKKKKMKTSAKNAGEVKR